MSLLKKLNIFTKEETKEEEHNEEAPAEETAPDGDGDTGSEEASEDGGEDTPSEENSDSSGDSNAEENSDSGEDASSEENSDGGEDTPSEESSDGGSEANSEEASEDGGEDSSSEESSDGGGDANSEESSDGGEDASSEETSDSSEDKPDFVTVLLNFFRTNKFVHDLFFFFCFMLVIFAGILSYGEFNKKEGQVSFDTLYQQIPIKGLCKNFSKGNMKQLVDATYIAKPYKGIDEKAEQALKEIVADNVTLTYEEIFSDKSFVVKKIACEYVKTELGDTHIISTCHLEIDKHEQEELVITFDEYKHHQFTIHFSSQNIEYKKACQELNAWFNYLTTAYQSEKDDTLLLALKENNEKAYEIVGSFFTSDATDPDEKDFGPIVALRMQALDNLGLSINAAYLDTYTYHTKKENKTTTLVLHITDATTNESLIYYQPLTIGLYGYEAKETGTIYGYNVRYEVSQALSGLFSY